MQTAQSSAASYVDPDTLSPETGEPFSKATTARYLVAFVIFAILNCAAFVLNGNTLMPQHLRDIGYSETEATTALGTITSLTAIVGLLSGYIWGAFSDHTRSRFGKRTPWIFAGSIVAGIGVNVRQRPEDFPEELRAIAGSVYSETGLELSRARLAAEMVRALDEMYLDWQRDPRAYLSDYRARCVTVGRPVRVVRGEDVRTGFAEAVDDDFALVVRWEDGTRETVTGGDVSVRGLFGYLD